METISTIKIEGRSYMTIQDFMKHRNVCRQTVYNWIETKKVNVTKVLNRQLIEV